MEKKKIKRKEEDAEKPQNPQAGSGAYVPKGKFYIIVQTLYYTFSLSKLVILYTTFSKKAIKKSKNKA